jgi:hypothetical protein
MADSTCCKLVGAFPGLDRCLISISSRINTEVSKVAGNLVIGPTIGVVSISAYINNNTHIGCPGRINVSIPWLRKYNCDKDIIYFLYQGEGQASIAGDVEELGFLNLPAVSYRTINASASSGPASIYEDEIQNDGYGLRYIGDPWSFNTNNSNSLTIDTGIADYGSLNLQSFSAQFQPGQLPTANYEFVYANNFSGSSSDVKFVKYDT